MPYEISMTILAVRRKVAERLLCVLASWREVLSTLIATPTAATEKPREVGDETE